MTLSPCRGCGYAKLEVVLDLGLMPLANGLLSREELDEPEARYPLALALCTRCCLAQLTESVDPELLFRRYNYFSSVSDSMVAHAASLVDDVLSRHSLGPDSLVIELASNDGYLLRHYVDRGVPVLGIEPARNVAETAISNGIPTIPEFFGNALAVELASSDRLADVVHANNVLAHVPDVHDFVGGIARILKPTGVVVIETPYLRDLVDRLEFDTIYHEHVYYYTLTSVSRILADHGLVVVDVERVAIHGGSLRLFIRSDPAERPRLSVRQMLDEEAASGVCSLAYFGDFATRVQELGVELKNALARLRADGKSVAAYGAAAKGTTLLNAFVIGADTIDFVADRSPHKQGRYVPGVRIPVVADTALAERRPDVCLLLAWNLADEVLGQQSCYRASGGTFMIPVPAIQLV